MVEAIANSSEDYLIQGLDFKLNPSASYIIDRKSVTFFTSGAQQYVSGMGARCVQIKINSSDGWLDPSTVRLHYTLKSEAADTHTLRPVGGPWGLFSRVRVLYQGAVVEDISAYNRTHEMMSILTSTNNRDNDDVSGFGRRWDNETYYPTYEQGSFRGGDSYQAEAVDEDGVPIRGAKYAYGGITGGKSKSVSFKPLCGILSQPKMLPMMWGGLVFEFELIGDKSEAFAVGVAGGNFLPGNTTTDWSMYDVRMTADIVVLDSGLMNSYSDHVLSGKSLNIQYGTYITMQQTVTGDNISVNVSRAVSRLKTIFCTFDHDYLGVNPATNPHLLVKKSWNYFHHPMALAALYDFDKEIEYQVQIGSKQIPEYPIRSVSGAHSELKKALGIIGSPWHSISPTYQQYIRDHFIIGIDCEKVLDAAWSGLNTKAGDLLTFRLKGANTAIPITDMPNRMYITLHSDNILEIRDSGASVYD